MSSQRKTAIVTGASQGIGAGIVKAFVERSFNVVANSRKVQRRLSITEGRALLTTTPYNLGWLKQKLWDQWEQSGRNHPQIDVIRFDSTENPAFPLAEFERVKRELPLWKFNMFYRAIFTRPAGLIYDCFDPKRHKVPRIPIPPTWHTYLGLDFGGVNTAGIFIAERPEDKSLWVYREYRLHDGATRTARQHVEALLAGEHKMPIAVGGAASEQVFRDEFRQAGLPVQEPEVMDSTTTSRNASSVEVDTPWTSWRATAARRMRGARLPTTSRTRLLTTAWIR
jgi:NAD(P)-dependent dehydrogenase (short-subunit alcohol dehydrogenase family)